MPATVCPSCGVFVDTVRHVRCQSCGLRFDDWQPVEPSPAGDPGPVLSEPVRPSEGRYGWLADGRGVASPPGPGVELYRALAVGTESVLLWRCDPETGDPVTRVFATTAPKPVWLAYMGCRR